MMMKAAKLNFLLGFLPFNMRAYNNHLVKTMDSIESVSTRKYKQIPHVAPLDLQILFRPNKGHFLNGTDARVG